MKRDWHCNKLTDTCILQFHCINFIIFCLGNFSTFYFFYYYYYIVHQLQYRELYTVEYHCYCVMSAETTLTRIHSKAFTKVYQQYVVDHYFPFQFRIMYSTIVTFLVGNGSVIKKKIRKNKSIKYNNNESISS